MKNNMNKWTNNNARAHTPTTAQQQQNKYIDLLCIGLYICLGNCVFFGINFYCFAFCVYAVRIEWLLHRHCVCAASCTASFSFAIYHFWPVYDWCDNALCTAHTVLERKLNRMATILHRFFWFLVTNAFLEHHFILQAHKMCRVHSNVNIFCYEFYLSESHAMRPWLFTELYVRCTCM